MKVLAQSKRRVMAASVLAITLSGMMTLSPTPGGADNGDGLEVCNYGEICMIDWVSSYRYQRHFWYGGWNHNNNSWWDLDDNHYQGNLRDDINRVKNRDMTCFVRIVDSDTGLSNTIPNNSVVFTLGSVVAAKNDYHYRYCF